MHALTEYILTADYMSSQIASTFNCGKVLTLSLPNCERYYQEFMNHLVDLQKIYESLIDEESRKVFRGYWLGNISGQFSALVHTYDTHYCTEGFLPERGAIFVEGGVMDGRTSAMFTDMGYKVYAFEMDKINFDDSKKVAEEKGFVLENLGLGTHNHDMNYVHAPWNNPGASRLVADGKDVAKIVSLDSYVREKNLPRVDCIKLDVEGAELDVLRGAATTIARWKPILLLSAYHKVDDFRTLWNFVNSIRSDYEWSIRHYGSKVDDSIRTLLDGRADILNYFGMPPLACSFEECCLLAR